MNIPVELKYTKSHEWVRVEGNVGTAGITAFAVSQINEIIFVELPQKGKVVTPGTPCGSIESVKAVFDLFCPVSGTVIEVNTAVNEHPEQVTKEPYGLGWMMKVALADPHDLDALMDAKGYEAHIAAESHH